MPPRKSDGRVHVNLSADLLTQLRELAEREHEGNQSRMARELVREALAARRARSDDRSQHGAR